MRPRLLFITPHLPDPEGIGGHRRAHAVLQALAARREVTVLHVPPPWVPDGPPPPPPDNCAALYQLNHDTRLRRRRSLAKASPRLFTLLHRRPLDWTDLSRHRLRRAAALLAGQTFSVIHAFRLSMAPYALALRRALPGAPALHLDIDDIESLTRERLAGLHRANHASDEALRERLNARAYSRIERGLLPRFDRLYVCSTLDANRLRPAHPDVRVLPNTMPAPATPPPPPGAGHTVRFLFIGTLGYPPNIDAVRWFCREILPALRAAIRCEFAVAGRGASDEFRRLLQATPGVVFIGEVVEAAPIYTDAHIVVAPIRAGGGTRLKILEAFAQNRPVVTTELGIEGIEACPGEDHLRADTTAEFIQACLRLANDSALRATLSRRAFQLVSSRYSPDALAAPLS